MKKYSKALAEKKLKLFIIRPIGWMFQFDGVLKQKNGAIQFKILNGFEDIASHDLDTQRFDIDFKSNLTSFQVQHKAISWMKEHNLFEQLIQNAEYESRSKCSVTMQNTFEFR